MFIFYISPIKNSRPNGLYSAGISLCFISLPVKALKKMSSFLSETTRVFLCSPKEMTLTWDWNSLVYLRSPVRLHPTKLVSYTWRNISPPDIKVAFLISIFRVEIDCKSFPPRTSQMLIILSPAEAAKDIYDIRIYTTLFENVLYQDTVNYNKHFHLKWISISTSLIFFFLKSIKNCCGFKYNIQNIIY